MQRSLAPDIVNPILDAKLGSRLSCIRESHRVCSGSRRELAEKLSLPQVGPSHGGHGAMEETRVFEGETLRSYDSPGS